MKRLSTLVLPLILSSALAAQAQVAPAPTPQRAPPAAKAPPVMGIGAAVAEFEGRVRVRIPPSEEWKDPVKGQMLSAGSQIQSLAGASAIVAFSDGTKVRIGPNASFKLEDTSPTRLSVFIGLGKLEAWVKRFAGRSFHARSPVAVASVRGTVFAMNVISPTEVTVDLFSGTLSLTDNFGRITSVAAGQRVEAAADKGVVATGSLPPTAKEPAEPQVTLPPPAPMEAPPPAEAPPPTEAPPTEEVPTEPTTTTTEAPAPTPTQETSTVSPSSP